MLPRKVTYLFTMDATKKNYLCTMNAMKKKLPLYFMKKIPMYHEWYKGKIPTMNYIKTNYLCTMNAPKRKDLCMNHECYKDKLPMYYAC